MNNNALPNLTPAQQQALLKAASQQLKISPETLENAVRTGKLNGLGNASQLEKYAADPKALEKLLSDPKTQAIIKKMMGGI